MKLNIDDIRNDAERHAKAAGGGRSSSGNWFKAGTGENRVRLAAFVAKTLGKVKFSRLIKVHTPKGGGPPIVCGHSPDRHGKVGDKCEYCDEARRIYEEEGKDAARSFWPRERMVFLVRPLMKADKPWRGKGLYQYSAPYTTVGKKIEETVVLCDEVEDVNEYFGPTGLDFRITFDRQAIPAEMYSVKVLTSRASPELADDEFASAEEMDLYADNTLEPYNWAPQEEEPASQPTGSDVDAEVAARFRRNKAPKTRAAPQEEENAEEG